MNRLLALFISSLFFVSCINNKGPKEITQYKWKLVSINNTQIEDGFGISFDGKHHASGLTSCNDIQTDYSFGKSTIKFTEGRRTSMACQGANFDLEADYAIFLDGKVDYQLEEGKLILSKGDQKYTYVSEDLAK